MGRLGSDELAGIVVDIVLTAATLLPLARAQQIANLANGRPVLDDEDDEDDEDA
ncbi:MAG: hypothetical protein ABUL60_08555 [Myxococcales bacterium]